MSRASLVSSLALLLAITLATAAWPVPLSAQVVITRRSDVPPVDAFRKDGLPRETLDFERFSEAQLDNLVGPVALYPDALLAQVLVAATFPDQVDDAARWVREHGTSGIDDQSWDVSVKSVAHYQSALNMMADKGDWTATLGRAYAYQSSEVMGAVQRMRRLADAQGNLVSSSQQQVVRESENYVIVPAQPRVIYVPVYDPVIVYTQPIFGPGFSSRLWSFGVGFPIGGWLNYDLDWRRRSVYYNGWDEAYFGYGGGWRFRSRPFIQFTTVYVSPRFLNVQVNRNVAYRSVNYHNVDRYAGYHRDVLFETRRDGYRDGYRDGRGDGRYDGRNNDGRYGGRYDDRDRNAPNRDNVGRTAQPRSDGATVSPDGYRNGLPQREAVRGDGRDAPRGDPRGGPQGEASSPRQAAPSERRQEPAARRMSPRAAEPRPAQPQASEPRSAPTRTAQPRGGSDGSRGSRERRGG